MFFFESHDSQISETRITKLLNKVDIYLPEFTSWEKTHLRLLEISSRGYLTKEDFQFFKDNNLTIEDNFKPNEKLNKESLEKLVNNIKPEINGKFWLLQIAKRLLGKNKIIGLIDVPRDSNLYTLTEKAITSLYKFRYSLIKKNYSFEQALEKYNKILKDFAITCLQKRDEFMLKNLPRVIRELIENNPSLQIKAKNKKPINILIVLGASHTWIWHNLNKAGFKTKAEFEAFPVVHDFEHEIIRRYRFGKKVSQELLAKTLLATMFKFEFLKTRAFDTLMYKTYFHITPHIRRIINALTIDDLKKIYERHRAFYKDPRQAKETPLEIWSEFIAKNKNSPKQFTENN